MIMLHGSRTKAIDRGQVFMLEMSLALVLSRIFMFGEAIVQLAHLLCVDHTPVSNRQVLD